MKNIRLWLKKWRFLIIVALQGILFVGYYFFWGDVKEVWASEEEKEVEGILGEALGPVGPEEDLDNLDVLLSRDNNPVLEQRETKEEEQEEILKEPVWGSVDDAYFQDTLFIGDSRTVGLGSYSGLKDISTFYAATGLSIYKLFEKPIVPIEGSRQKQTVGEALAERQFSRIYVMLGINEMGSGSVERFTDTYRDALAYIRQLQPEAVLYIQSVIKVTEAKSSEGTSINNAGIDERNEALSALADNAENIYYLDVNPVLCDENGNLNPEYTGDGIHLKAKYYALWEDYLRNNAVIEK